MVSVISQLLLALGVVAISVYCMRQRLYAAFDTQLNAQAMNIAALVRYSEEARPRLIFENELVPPSLEQEHPDLYQVYADDGSMIARSPHWPRGSVQDADKWQPPAQFSYDGVVYRGISLRIPVLDQEPDAPNTAHIMVSYAAPTTQISKAIGLAIASITASSTLLLLLTIWLTALGVRRGLRPLAELTSSAALVSGKNWELQASEASLRTTELMPLSQAMTTMLARLRSTFAQQREFVANAAHELKTPVAILKSTLQSLVQKPRDAVEYRVGLEQALNDLERLEKLLHSMLCLARAEQWTMETRTDLETVDVTTTCESAVERMEPLAREYGVQLELSSTGPATLRCDPADLELVWTNLLENAIRFTTRGDVVQVSVRADAGNIAIEVQDRGPGVPESDLAHLFDRFYRCDSSRARGTGGYGLGLAISKAMIEAYGGTISAESAQGRGTCMKIQLPLERATLSQTHATAR